MPDKEDDAPVPSSPPSKPARPTPAPFFAPRGGAGAGATPPRPGTPSERTTMRPFASPPAKSTPEQRVPRVTPPTLAPHQLPQPQKAAESVSAGEPKDAKRAAPAKDAAGEWLEEPAWLRDTELPTERADHVQHGEKGDDSAADTAEEAAEAREWQPEKTQSGYGGEHGRPDSFSLEVELEAGAARIGELGAWEESEENREISAAFAPQPSDIGGRSGGDDSTQTLGGESGEDAWWDPAEERGTTLEPPLERLERLKEEEPWATSAAFEDFHPPPQEDAAAALERIAQRIRTGELNLPPATPAESDAAVLAEVLAALLRPGNG